MNDRNIFSNDISARIRFIAFDADDTLWDNQGHFEAVEQEYCRILAPYGNAKEIMQSLCVTEESNMPLLGYGCKAFTISLIENAIRISHQSVTAKDVARIVDLGKSLLTIKAEPLPGVEETLKTIRESRQYKLILFTKGELLDQQNKLERSGLKKFFDEVFIVSNKTDKEYRELCRNLKTDFRELLMVGNSFKSDVEPVLRLGGNAIYIPFHVLWKHEEAEEYDHRRLIRISDFRELTRILL